MTISLLLPSVKRHERPRRDGNAALALLSSSTLSLIKPHLQQDKFVRGQVLWEAGTRPGRIFFPDSGLISMTIPAPAGHGIEVGSISCEGAAGIHRAFGYTTSATSGIVLSSGTFRHISAQRFVEAARQSEELAAFANINRDWILWQAQHLAACNAIHTADGRFCRWIAFACQRMGTDIIPLTQEDIAAVLGIRRTTVTAIAQKLGSDGLIDYSRAKIHVCDLERLTDAACRCHAAFSRAYWPSERLSRSRFSQPNTKTSMRPPS